MCSEGMPGRGSRAAAGCVHNDRMESQPDSLAKYFDDWYADMTGSPVKDEIQQRHLGLPPHLLSTSLLGWDGSPRPPWHCACLPAAYWSTWPAAGEVMAAAS